MAVFLKDIEQGKVPLKHVDAIADKSSPVIEAGIKIGSNPMADVKKGIAAGAKLKHVESVDRSAPIIEADVKVHGNARPALFAELKSRSFVEAEP